jgi:Anti-sigma-K factor rskA, C-terminal
MTADDQNPGGPPAEAPGAMAPAGFLGWLPWIAAATAALAAGFLVEVYLANRAEIAILDDRYDLAVIETKSLQQQLEAERILSARRIADLTVDTRNQYDLSACDLIPLHSSPAGSSPVAALVVWDARRQQGTLVARQLPAVAAGREYRLWIVDPRNPVPFAAGGFAGGAPDGRIDFAFKSARAVRDAPGFIVTSEAPGPFTRPGGPVILSGP